MRTNIDIKGFLLRFFAVVGITLSVWIGWGIYAALIWVKPPAFEQTLPESVVLDLDFSNPLIEAQEGVTISLPTLLNERNQTPYYSIVRALDRAKDDPAVKGVVARFGIEVPTLVHGQEIAAALRRFRESGKFTYVFAPSYGDFTHGSSLYYLASQFENIWLQPVGSVGLMGLSLEAPFGKTALEKWGIQGDFLRRNEYKSVMENVTNDSFSPPVKKNMEDMIFSLSDQIVDGIAKGRKMEAAHVKKLIEDGPFTTKEAFQTGLVSKIGYKDDMDKEVKSKAGDKAERIDPATYLALTQKNRDKSKAKVAVIYADGMIVDMPPQGPYRLAQGEVIDTQGVADAFQNAADSDEIKAIIFRVNSPGGAPVASETMRHALVRAKESKKPVIVSMGRVAASGGYWICMNGDSIIANPATITGSIGVVAGKIVLGGLFDKFDVKWDGVKTTESADMWSARTPFSPKARERMTAMVDETYNNFKDNVATARNIPQDKIESVAGGRVFTGEQALKAGLVDKLGGMEEAVATTKARLGLEPTDRVQLVQFPSPETPQTLFLKMLRNLKSGGAMVRDLLSAWRKVSAVLGPLAAALDQTQSGISAQLPTGYAQ